MIKIINIEKSKPYDIFVNFYNKAQKSNQPNIDCICISSLNKNLLEVNSRYVNLKFIKNNEFIFYSNYNSQKSIEFDMHNKIAATIFWSTINIQIRIKAKIKKTSSKHNQNYFSTRSQKKNALAIASYQSRQIDSYQEVIKKYQEALKNENLNECPEYWGGFSFVPYYFEFWEGHESRINKREVFDMTDGVWKHSFLQP